MDEINKIFEVLYNILTGNGSPAFHGQLHIRPHRQHRYLKAGTGSAFTGFLDHFYR
jgi:hypothetical protein